MPVARARHNRNASPKLSKALAEIHPDEAKAADDERSPVREEAHETPFLATHKQWRCASDSKRSSDSMSNMLPSTSRTRRSSA